MAEPRLAECPFCGAAKLLTTARHMVTSEPIVHATFQCTDCGAALTGSAPRAQRMFPLGDLQVSASVDAAKSTLTITSREDWSRLFGGTAPDFGHTQLLEHPGERDGLSRGEIEAFRAAYQKLIDGQLLQVAAQIPYRAGYDPEPFETEE